MQASKITLSIGDLVIDRISRIVGFLIGIEDYSRGGHIKVKCWRVFWVGGKVLASEAYQSWTEIGLMTVIETGGFEHIPAIRTVPGK